MVLSHQSKTTTRQRHFETNVEPVHFYYAFHTRFVGPGVKGIIEMHRFNICFVVLLSLSFSGVKAPLYCYIIHSAQPSNLIGPFVPRDRPGKNDIGRSQHDIGRSQHDIGRSQHDIGRSAWKP